MYLEHVNCALPKQDRKFSSIRAIHSETFKIELGKKFRQLKKHRNFKNIQESYKCLQIYLKFTEQQRMDM